MPEAFAVLFVFVVAVGVYIFAKFQTARPSAQDARENSHRLRRHHAWLRQRMEMAERERWDAGMIRAIADELAVTSARLAKAPPVAVNNARADGLGLES